MLNAKKIRLSILNRSRVNHIYTEKTDRQQKYGLESVMVKPLQKLLSILNRN